jgi:predicted membrane-bound spermidine synthase
MSVYVAIIFITGAVTLALELLASRIMTPYFGVSLYIWTGILSITLVSLAFGYFLGGRLAGRAVLHDNYPDRLRRLFMSMPAISAISLGIACLTYPWAFFKLANVSLVFGSFVACVVLLFVPLVTLSALNPLLIALRSSGVYARSGAGDSGSGLVFFISTVGSVLGVWITAFLFIPNLTNFTSVLLLGILLSLISLVCVLTLLRGGGRPRIVMVTISITGLALCGGVLAGSSLLLGKDGVIVSHGTVWKLEKEYMSLFGNTKIITMDRDAGEDPASIDDDPDALVLYFQDGTYQNVTDHTGTSQAVYTYALEGLAMAFLNAGDRALVLGLGAGLVPMRLAARGVEVDVVEINPSAFQIARELTGFDEQRISSFQQDARGFVRHCPRRYTVIVVDLFGGDGTPEYLLTRDFFADVNRCLLPGGAVVMNALTVPRYYASSYYMFKTVLAVFSHLLVFHDDFVHNGRPINLFLVTTNRESMDKISVSLDDVPRHLLRQLARIFSRSRPLDEAMLARATVIRDEFNIFPILNQEFLMAYRRMMLSIIPPPYLVN